MLKTIVKSMLTTLAVVSLQNSATGFSLLGPFDAYQTSDLGYNPPFTTSAENGDLGGPMNLGEEYRWTTPFIVYGFDQTFVEYFGEKGVAAVESAIATLNNLPVMSELSAELSEYPLESTRFNYTAQQLGIIDIKSLIMSCMLEQLGLAAPERYVKTIYQQRPTPNGFDYTVVTRNFSPVLVDSSDFRSYSYSPYVNGTLYTYAIRRVLSDPEYYDAQDIAVDVSNPRVTVAAAAGLQTGAVDPRVEGLVNGSIFSPAAGRFYTGFTRDDVGGLRYLYHSSRTNNETLPLGSTLASSVGGGGGSSAGGSGLPWTITIPSINTNIVTSTTNSATGTAGLVDAAWRGGVDKLVFVRRDPDPFISQYPRPIYLRYTERVFDASRQRMINQTVQRTFIRPDITFAAADIGAFPDSPVPYVYTRTLQFNNNFAINTTAGRTAAGPGTIEAEGGGSVIILNKVGPWTYNATENTEDDSVRGFTFGTFDGTTNSPIVFPTGVTVKELERAIYGRN
jgi:hypothetical protein